MSALTALNQALQKTLPMAHLEVTALPECSPLQLALINAAFPTGPLPREVMNAVIERPAYWCLCWGAGIALARFLKQEPHWVAGARVVDLGSGCGIGAIAAAAAGAEAVVACDTDSDARLATATNAGFNNVAVEVTAKLPDHCDVLLMADVLYDKRNLPLLREAQRRARRVLVADSRVHELTEPGYREIRRLRALTYPNLGEFDEYATTRLFLWER